MHSRTMTLAILLAILALEPAGLTPTAVPLSKTSKS